MKSIFAMIMLFSLSLFACQVDHNQKKENSAKQDTLSTSKIIKEQPIASPQEQATLLKSMQAIADTICGGMTAKDFFNFQYQGQSAQFYLSQNLRHFSKEDLESYSLARQRARCCIEAISKGQPCADYKKAKK